MNTRSSSKRNTQPSKYQNDSNSELSLKACKTHELEFVVLALIDGDSEPAPENISTALVKWKNSDELEYITHFEDCKEAVLYCWKRREVVQRLAMAIRELLSNEKKEAERQLADKTSSASLDQSLYDFHARYPEYKTRHKFMGPQNAWKLIARAKEEALNARLREKGKPPAYIVTWIKRNNNGDFLLVTEQTISQEVLKIKQSLRGELEKAMKNGKRKIRVSERIRDQSNKLIAMSLDTNI